VKKLVEWFLTGLSLLGCWFNIQKSVTGWVIWSVANVGWIISFLAKEMFAESTLFSVYLILSLYGIVKWRKPAGEKIETAG